ncbi:RdgB/HAM1 family non-canonical purine NTP pyrophosphatase [Ferriphaselus sp. R-1]|uniref:RdgB/HAM1 family non-canonical purine NTP pyrophosphatase n=1 Tax=Ferriphaselus sp. R-1 TaxID=1485544 RepID=UPI000551EA5B|nr:RdgB/HAM1 family non-canonical purine NTP pyrophosphatase [Ferriphaselus sp. R-1]
MDKLVIASNNPGKLREFERMLAPLGIEVLTQAQLGISEADEPHCTFVENALAKARHVSRASGLPALADDSGICVDALGGAPGVISARYAGDSPKSDQRNTEKLLHEMQGISARQAHYYCVLVLVRHADDPQPLIAEGEWHGEIAHEARGDDGFGYDPYFWLADYGKTAAELPHEEKAKVSHRAVALGKLLARLTDRLPNS